jgi:hypothetical protein
MLHGIRESVRWFFAEFALLHVNIAVSSSCPMVQPCEHFTSAKISNCGLALIVALSLNKILLLFETHLFFERLLLRKFFR